MTAMPPSTITEWQPRSSLIRHKASSKDTRPSADGTSRIKTPRWSKALALSHLSFDPLVSAVVVSIVNGFGFAVPVSACALTKADVRGVRRLESKTSGCGLGPGTNRAVNWGSSSRSVPTPILGAHQKTSRHVFEQSVSSHQWHVQYSARHQNGIMHGPKLVRHHHAVLNLKFKVQKFTALHEWNYFWFPFLGICQQQQYNACICPSLQMWLWATWQTTGYRP